MELDTLRANLLGMPGSAESAPFGPQALVYKVMGKMFALVGWEEDPLSISLKCDPDQALLWRDVYPAVTPGYHMNKRNWNTIVLDGSVPVAELLGMIDDSYSLVVKGLTRAQKEELGRL